METYVTGTGQVMRVHERDTCQGTWCVIHKPMPGPTADWPTHWRGDEAFDIARLMERICPHGVGHPAPEQFEHWGRSNKWYMTKHGPCYADCCLFCGGSEEL